MAEQQKWEGKVSAKLTSFTADQVWPLLADFCNLSKWLPTLGCKHLDGSPAPGQLGCIRVISGPAIPSDDGTMRPGISAQEKLIMIDPTERCLSYEIIENNLGFKNYVATMKVSSGDNDNQNGCVIDWSYITDPREGWKPEDLFCILKSSMDSVVKGMEEAS
ncbi:hypothetical protein AQUCO_08600022v1 [Aquilegia coerulea]|uniref:Bet v I/Major latex protein domain-containing protein n=1 Tax=Aquilegia coerulea TaxID=218851 RepID=A0A2G5C6H1_AQUCA|nr:hypothetical protein AQUCO_08600022v1 [Aquilegia coerulea]